MPYDEKLAERIGEIIAETHPDAEEKRMFSGVCFMVNDKMCAGVQQNRLMLRIDPAMVEEVTGREGFTPMEMRGKIMKSFVLVDSEALTSRKKLRDWLQLALDYNPLAKASKKKKKN